MVKVSDYPVLKDTSKITAPGAPSFSGIVTRECKGNLWVDDLIHPTIALAKSYAVGSFAFLGIAQANKALQNLQRFLENTLFVELLRRGNDYFEFSIENDEMREDLLALWADREIQMEREFSLRIKEEVAGNSCTYRLFEDYQMLEVTEGVWNLLLAGNYENSGFLKTRLLESWYSFEQFKEHSLAYCVIFENRLVGVIIGTASFQKIIPIDIETEEVHRGKGLGTALALQFVEGCKKRGLTPQWDCVESNPASFHLAKKIGFEKVRENTVYWFKL